jgi:Fe-S cluster biogenesis protein NfuA
MFIQTEDTPNPNSLKFIPGCSISPENLISFNSIEDAKISPLASKLMHNPSVDSVFFGADFIAINKKTEANWDNIKPELLIAIMEHFISKRPIFIDLDKESENLDTSEDSEIVKQIKEVIETRVRPAVASDGGDVVFNRFENGVVYLEMRGACAGCPSSSYTLKEGIENMLKHYIPEVESVEQA